MSATTAAGTATTTTVPSAALIESWDSADNYLFLVYFVRFENISHLTLL